MKYLQFNQFAELHNPDYGIVFSHADLLFKSFEEIKERAIPTILITGNSDRKIDDHLVEMAPRNVKKWYCQNRVSNSDLLESIPIGIENTQPCKVKGHGHVWDWAEKKLEMIRNSESLVVDLHNLIYANFNIMTNLDSRTHLQNFVHGVDHITKDQPNLKYTKFVEQIKKHKAVLCPDGNGPDTHRIYEVLYMGRIPITFNKVQYDFLHHKFPVLLVENMLDLKNKELMEDQIENLYQNFDTTFFDTERWISEIKRNI